ncbi:MAG: hypothetical protein J5632_02740 [Bacteroidales bacterium]|nr:hypothetical protein [Bacteroidales bacterium]
MKRIFIALGIVLACASTDMLAQTSAKDRLKEIEEMAVNAHKRRVAKHNDLFSCDGLSHFYFGFHQVSGQKELEGKFFQSHEIGFNVLQLGLNPANWVSLNAGLDLKWDQFELAKGYAVEMVDHKFAFNEQDRIFADVTDFNQRIRTFALAVPVSLGFHAPWFSVKGGAEFDFNINKYTCIKTDFVQNKYIDVHSRNRKPKVENTLINYFAAVDFDGTGLYFRYYPKSIFRDNSLAGTDKNDMKYWTLGLIFTF